MAAKLRAPVPLAPLVSRPRIEALLNSAVRKSVVVLLVGPSGSGKTAALTHWSRTREAAWITLDQQDNDPTQFWRYVATSLGITAHPHQPGSDAFVAALADDLKARGSRPVLVLDEYEHLVAPGIHRQLDLLIRASGNDLVLVIAGRARPPLRLERPRLADRLAILTWADLRFSPEEAEELLSNLGKSPSPTELERLAEETEGWAGGLLLTGSTLTDYLLEHVWAGLEPEFRQFLLESAVPHRFDVSLMDAIRGGKDAAGFIDRLRRDALFLVSDDGAGRWYRHQRTFRAALLHRLETTDPARATSVRRAAAGWHASFGDKEEAVGLALAAGDYRLAVRLLNELFDGLYRAGRLVPLGQWLSALPDSELAGSGLGRRALNLWCELGRFGERDRWIAATGESSPIGPDEAWRLCLPRERGDLTFALRQGRTLLATKFTPSAARGVSSATAQAASQARISVARTSLLAGQLDESQALAEQIPGLWQAEPPAPVRGAVNGLVGLSLHLRGELVAAAHRATEVRKDLEACRLRPTARMMPEAMILMALYSDHPVDELTELVDGQGYGSDRTMGAFASLLLARCLGGSAAAARLAAADALLASCPNPLGLVELRNQVAAEIGVGTGPDPSPTPREPLSDREIRVLQYLRSELTLREIAEDLFLSVNTVKTHAGNVYRKLGVSGRHELTSP